MPMPTDVDRTDPKRLLSKQQAIRHLLHCAIRLIMRGEDPFAIHLLIQSADKMLIDVAKNSGKTLNINWEPRLRPERKKDFFSVYRETYNFFKHADRDVTENLPVHEIARMNVLMLFICIENYRAAFGTVTDHMQLHILFVQVAMPGIFIIEAGNQARLERALATIANQTPTEYFSVVSEHHTMFVEGFARERAEDLQDTTEFYSTPFSKLRDAKLEGDT